jgi:hypothetical protein
MKQPWKMIAAFAAVGSLSASRGQASSTVLDRTPLLNVNDSIPDSVPIYPFAHQHFVCLEHPSGQLKRLGDALGSDCVIVGFQSGSRAKFPTFYRGAGAQNSDWLGWNANVLAPFNGVVDSVHANDVTNTPGTLGRERASMIVFRRDDGLRVLFAHVQSILVRVGDTVRKGQRVAKVGNNGPAYFPHTHIGAYKNGRPLQIRFDLAAMGAMSRKP